MREEQDVQVVVLANILSYLCMLRVQWMNKKTSKNLSFPISSQYLSFAYDHSGRDDCNPQNQGEGSPLRTIRCTWFLYEKQGSDKRGSNGYEFPSDPQLTFCRHVQANHALVIFQRTRLSHRILFDRCEDTLCCKHIPGCLRIAQLVLDSCVYEQVSLRTRKTMQNRRPSESTYDPISSFVVGCARPCEMLWWQHGQSDSEFCPHRKTAFPGPKLTDERSPKTEEAQKEWAFRDMTVEIVPWFDLDVP